MAALILFGLVAGLITGISPCILPVLPAVFVAGGSATGSISDDGVALSERGTGATAAGRRRSLRPYAVIAGLVTSFTVFTLLGTALLSALHVPQDLLRNLGLLILIAVGVGLLVPRFGELLERPFARVPAPRVNAHGAAFVLGMGLGLLYVPCAGPVLTAITVVSASGRIGIPLIAVTLAFAIGAAIPLLLFALAGDQVASRVRGFRRHAPVVRRFSGVVLIVTAVLLASSVTDSIQRVVPGYTAALQAKVEKNSVADERLAALRAGSSEASTALTQCDEAASTLQDCGPAPEFRNIDRWINTPGSKPLSLSALQGKVVLIDFWTYSCINCQRTLPQVEAWSKEYASAGLVVVGVHTPEFAFEHVPSNVAEQTKALGVTYPVAIDNHLGTWNAYANQYWPAEYLIDATGTVRHVHFGEGGSATTETLIRQLLVAARSTPAALPRATSVKVETPGHTLISPETYLGYQRISQVANPQIAPDASYDYRLPRTVPTNTAAFGGTWSIGPEYAKAGPGARLDFAYGARSTHLVLGGTGTVRVSVDGRVVRTVTVKGVPTLYTLTSAPFRRTGRLMLDVSPGVEAYAFTFG